MANLGLGSDLGFGLDLGLGFRRGASPEWLSPEAFHGFTPNFGRCFSLRE